MTAEARQKPIMRRRRVGWSLLVFAVVLGGLGWGGYRWLRGVTETADAIVLTDIVRRGPFEHVVLEQGEVESSKNIELICEVKSRNSSGTAILWVIPEGTAVQEGDKLVELDSSALENELKQQRIQVNSALAAKISAESTLEQALVAKQEYLNGTFAQEEKVVQSEILVAQEKLSRAKETAKYSERLAALGFQTTLQLRADQFAVEQAQVELELAQNKLKTLREITKKKMLIQFDADIEKARAQVQATTSSYQEEVQKLLDIEDQIAKCHIYAPAPGVVVYANEYSSRGNSEFIVQPGTLVRERQVILRLPDPTQMRVRAKINEARIPLVKEQMPVAIRIPALDDVVVPGVVTKVNKYAEPGSWFSSQVKEYVTFIQILEPPPGLRNGMTAEVRIFVDRRSDALQVPVQALYQHEGRLYCLVKTQDGFETRLVEIGPASDKKAVVLSGLQEGETVVINPRAHEKKFRFPELPPLEAAPTELATTTAGLAPVEASQSAAHSASSQPASADASLHKDAATRTHHSPAPPPEKRPTVDAEVVSRVARWMSRFDINGDSKLSLEELARADRAARGKLQEADTNRDGLLDFRELTRLGDRLPDVPTATEEAGGGGG
jgi:HlyD family secretion protein